MADTQLTRVANRLGSVIFLSGSSAGVAINATVAESFFAPEEVGDLLITAGRVYTGVFSAAYVAPPITPVSGALAVVSADLATYIDTVGDCDMRGRLGGNGAGLWHYDPVVPVLLRRGERLLFVAPLLAASGTATFVCEIRAARLPVGAS